MGTLAHALLAAAALPLLIAFAWQPGIASISDDSVSYLLLGRWFAGTAGPQLTPWLPWHSHFPPLFPAVLALTGGATNLYVAHAVVAALAAVSLWLLARYAALRLESDLAALAVAALFLLAPTSWINAKGILSETLYLALSLGALLVHESRIARGRASVGAFVAFGVLMAAVYSTRAVGAALVAAYAVHAAIRFAAGERRWPAVIPFAAVLAVAGLWLAVRPPAHAYSQMAGAMAHAWLEHPLEPMRLSGTSLLDGWIASFTAEADVPLASRAALAALAALALAGTLRAAARNRLDGWYVLAFLGMVALWPFGGEAGQRLLYPVVPLALVHGGEILRAIAKTRRGRLAAFGIAILAGLICVPAAMLVATRAQDGAPLAEGVAHGAREMTDYYRVINLGRARALAAKHAAVIAGLERLGTDTPPAAKVLWVRPEYVAVLGARDGVPWYFGWDERTLASRILEAHVDYVVVTGLFKTDLDARMGNAGAMFEHLRRYAEPQVVLRNAVTGAAEYVLLRVDPAALRAFVARADSGASGAAH